MPILVSFIERQAVPHLSLLIRQLTMTRAHPRIERDSARLTEKRGSEKWKIHLPDISSPGVA
jgi:hypothetical protein